MKPRRVFITGGASGLGCALAERYARAGCRVAIGDRDAERGDFWILTHPEGRLAWMGKRLLPFRLYAWSVRLAARRMMRRPGATRR